MSDVPEEDPKPTDRCPCGSQKFLVKEMKLVLHDVPLVYDGSLGTNMFGPYTYDDSKAGDCDGWDRVVDDDVRCAACGKTFEPDPRTDLLIERVEV